MRIALQLRPWLRVLPVMLGSLLCPGAAFAAPVDRFQPAAGSNATAFDSSDWSPVDQVSGTSAPQPPRTAASNASIGAAVAPADASTALVPAAATLAPSSAATEKPPLLGKMASTSPTMAPAPSLGPHERVVSVSQPYATPALTQTQPMSDPVETYRLEAGLPLEDQLLAWCKRAGWTLLWNLPSDANWIVPGGHDYGTDFEQAITKVMQTLAANGADVRGRGFRDNRTFVVRPGGNQ
ncbi:TcpQ domain-containing protein [Burkholderia gladioli]|uniref:TcpQ domain-containing protein n=1 Tax=Burkholderia gladioli TaxID=28095 RepID=UPI001FC858BA|nr:TcpQ domain-containing protein [Burkholderia gladioli]